MHARGSWEERTLCQKMHCNVVSPSKRSRLGSSAASSLHTRHSRPGCLWNGTGHNEYRARLSRCHLLSMAAGFVQTSSRARKQGDSSLRTLQSSWQSRSRWPCWTVNSHRRSETNQPWHSHRRLISRRRNHHQAEVSLRLMTWMEVARTSPLLESAQHPCGSWQLSACRLAFFCLLRRKPLGWF